MAKKGSIPWNKGLTKETNETVRRLGELNSIRLKGSISPKRKYSMDPNDWVVNCDVCGKEIKYLHRGSYARRIRDKKKGIKVKCKRCANLGKTYSEEARKRMSEAQKNRIIDPIKEKKRSEHLSKSQKKRYANMTPEEFKAYREKQILGYKNMDPNKKKEQYRKISLIRKEEMKRLGTDDIFKPSYNKESIV